MVPSTVDVGVTVTSTVSVTVQPVAEVTVAVTVWTPASP